MPQPIVVPAVAAANPDSGFFEGAVPPRGAYLQVLAAYPHWSEDADDDGIYDKGVLWDSNNDGTRETHYIQAPLIVNLAAQGFIPGDRMMIGTKQSMYSTTHSYFAYTMYGLFSSSDKLLTDDWVYNSPNDGLDWPMNGPLHRVAGAIDVALGGYSHRASDNTDANYMQGQEVPTDIPEDFCLIGPVLDNTGRNGIVWTPNTWWYSNCLWVTVPPGANFLFVAAVSQWMIGTDGTCSVTLDEDSDGDAIPDSWERGSIDINKDGITDLTLTGASDSHKDLFVEVDYMQGHKPMDAAMEDVRVAFSHAPNALVDNPDGKDGINLHIQMDEQTIHQDVLYVWEGFDSMKSSYFGTFDQRTASNSDDTLQAKKMTFRYCLFNHQLAFYDSASSSFIPDNASGVSELPGNDFIVSLGPVNGGTKEQQSAAFMHELGHALDLHHGGAVDENYKPNYLSIMNYLFEFENDPIPNRPLDYSRSALPTINETHLDEFKGVSTNGYEPSYYGNWIWTSHSDAIGNPLLDSLYPIDWNNDSSFDSNAAADINNFINWDSPSGKKTDLTGYEDWSHLLYFIQDTKEFADGAHLPVHKEITWDTVAKMQQSAFKVHDVAVLNGSCASNSIEVGGTLDVNVTIMNKGTYDEQTEVCLMLNSTEVITQNITLAAGEVRSVHLTYVLKEMSSGAYPLSVNLTAVSDEFVPTDNSFDYGSIQVSAGEIQEGIPSWVWMAVIGVVIVAGVAILFVMLRSRKRK